MPVSVLEAEVGVGCAKPPPRFINLLIPTPNTETHTYDLHELDDLDLGRMGRDMIVLMNRYTYTR